MTTTAPVTPTTHDTRSTTKPAALTGARTPRGRRGTAATLTALIGTAVCAAGAVEAVSMAMHRRAIGFSAGRVAKFGRDTHLDDSVVLIVGIVAAVVGIVLLAAALLPARRRLVELREPDPGVAAGLTPRSFRRTLAAAAESVDGVREASVKGRRRLTVRATTTFRNVDTLPTRIEERVTARLAELAPLRARTVRVRLTRKED